MPEKLCDMYIANPIYDATFKFLSEDEKVAKKFISTIIGEQINEPEIIPRETTLAHLKGKDGYVVGYTVCSLDFLANIDTATGRETVIIELQKAKLPTDIMRFRRSLDERHRDERNDYEENGKITAKQIYCIFFIDDKFGVGGVPVMKKGA